MKQNDNCSINEQPCSKMGQGSARVPRVLIPEPPVYATETGLNSGTGGQGDNTAFVARLWCRAFWSPKVMTLALVLGVAGALLPARAQDSVYSVEFNQANNRFGILDLMNGHFT